MEPDEKRGEGLPDETPDVASATECTGLMPALPRTDAEDADRAALYAVHRGRKSRKMFRIR